MAKSKKKLTPVDKIIRVFKVHTPSGNVFEVMTKEEQVYAENLFREYTSKFEIENPADLTLLESLVSFQVLLFRTSKWLMRGIDYDGNPVDIRSLNEVMTRVQKQIIELQDKLKISKTARSQENLSAADIINEIVKRAKEYGIHKNKVAWKFLLAYYEIKHWVGVYLRNDEKDRKASGATADEVIKKIHAILKDIEQYEDEFREKQKLWLATVQEGIIDYSETID